jgi:hypothetical protein
MRVSDIGNRPVGVVWRAWEGGLSIRLDNGQLIKVSDQAVYYVNDAVRLVCNRDRLARYLID